MPFCALFINVLALLVRRVPEQMAVHAAFTLRATACS
jgi:hypothetical protein